MAEKNTNAKAKIEVVNGELSIETNLPPFQVILLLSEAINAITRQSLSEVTGATEDLEEVIESK